MGLDERGVGRSTVSPSGTGVDSTPEGELEEERPDDAVDCPRCDQWWAPPDCALCGGRRWVYPEAIRDHMGTNEVWCLQCGGEGEADGPGPVSWSCLTCLG